MHGAISHKQTPRLLRDRRVHYRARNYILARKVALCRMDSPGPLELVGWRLHQVLQQAANQRSVSGVSHRIAYPWPRVPHITPTSQVASPPVQRQDPLATCYNSNDNYLRALLSVALTNLHCNLGAPGLQPQLRLSCHRDRCKRVGVSEQ